MDMNKDESRPKYRVCAPVATEQQGDQLHCAGPCSLYAV